MLYEVITDQLEERRGVARLRGFLGGDDDRPDLVFGAGFLGAGGEGEAQQQAWRGTDHPDTLNHRGCQAQVVPGTPRSPLGYPPCPAAAASPILQASTAWSPRRSGIACCATRVSYNFV